MIPKEIVGFQGEMTVQEFGDWIEVLSHTFFEEGTKIHLPTNYFSKYFLVKEAGLFFVRYSMYAPFTINFPILYFTEDGKTYRNKCTYCKDKNIFLIEKWEKVKKLVNVSRASTFIINAPNEINAILGTINPYAYRYAENKNYPKEAFIIAPELELLSKAGYCFADKLLDDMSKYNRYFETLQATINEYNRLVNNGEKNIKKIFKTDKCVYSVLKEESNLKTWDNFRRMYKKGRLTAQDIEEVYNSGYSEKDLKLIDEILLKNDGKNSYFTIKTLFKYLEKIDRYEAIDFYEGIDLLKDYLSMCAQLKIKPNLTSDSLKREHDVTARIFRMKKDEILDEKMQRPCKKAAKYNYSEGTFFIRSVEGYDDLVDEAIQQRNCVASYGNSIADGKTMVFVMRQNKHPNKSIATVELTRTGEIRQARLAFNRPITNKAQNDFLKRWRKHVLDIMHGKIVC